MKRDLLFSLLCAFFLFSSCVTGIRKGSFANYPEGSFFGDYRINSVSVTVDHVKEDSIASQLSMITQTYLDSKQFHGIDRGKTLLLDITVEQRSFIHDVEFYNAIYVSCVIRDEAGNIYGKENKYISGKRTVIAAVDIDRIMRSVLDRILAYRQKNEK
jgi:hypothetical protein